MGQPICLDGWLWFEKKIVLHAKTKPLRFLLAIHLLDQIKRTIKISWDQTNYFLVPPRLLVIVRLLFLLNYSKLLIMLMLMLLSSYKRIETRLSKRFSRLKTPKKDYYFLGISSSPSHLTSIVLRHTWTVRTSISNVSTIFPPLEPPVYSQILFAAFIIWDQI